MTQYNITDGTSVGANLFHSFGEFGVPENNIANFQNNLGLAIDNILGRVTGDNPSNIFGTIQTEGFGNANLFLMNPAGMVFGPNATLNVSGSAHFTTADYLRTAELDGTNAGVFYSDPGSASELTSAPASAFGFLGPTVPGVIPQSISVEGSTLVVQPGRTLSLVGGNITIGSSLSAQGGTVVLASTASAGEFSYPAFGDVPNVNGDTFSDKGTIRVQEGTTVDVSGDAAGTVIIRGGELVMTNAVISARNRGRFLPL